MVTTPACSDACCTACLVVVVPLALALWAARLEPVVPLRVQAAPALGVAAAALGLVLLALGIADLIRRGRGLPMNAFPPRLFVRAGVYRWIRNPIYVGFGLSVAGVALARRSAAGLWVVAPITVLGMLALVWGYERHDLVARFGPSALDPPLLSLPRDVDGPPTPSQRAAVYVWVLLPWLAAFYGVQALGRAPDVFTTVLPVERGWPVLQWTEALYVLAYVTVPTAPLVALGARGLRRFAVAGIVGTLVVTLLWLVIPTVIGTPAIRAVRHARTSAGVRAGVDTRRGGAAGVPRAVGAHRRRTLGRQRAGVGPGLVAMGGLDGGLGDRGEHAHHRHA